MNAHIRKSFIFRCLLGSFLFCLLIGCSAISSKPIKKQKNSAPVDLRLKHEKASTLLKQGDSSFTKGRYLAAISLYEAYIAKAGFSVVAERVLFRLSLSAFHVQQTDTFIRYQSLLKQWFPASEYAPRLLSYAWQLYIKVKKYKAAVVVLKQLLIKNSTTEDLGLQNRLRFNLAICYEKLYMPTLSINQLLLVVRSNRKDKECAFALHRLGKHFFQKNQRELALFYVDTLLKDFPKYPKRPQVLVLKRSIRWRYITKHNGLGDNSISTIAFDGDDIWVGTWIGGISRFTRSDKQAVHFSTKNSSLASNLVRDIKITSGRVWAATFAGLSYYNKGMSRWHTIYSVAGLAYQRIKALLVVDGKLWVATIAHGLSVFDLAKGKWRTYTRKDGLPDNNVVTLCATPGSIWAGTVAGGVARFDLKNERWKVYRKGGAGKLPSNNVKSIAFDGTRLWFGTHGYGVASCAEDGSRWKVYNTANSGLSSNYVYSLAVGPKGKVWMGTLEGGAVSYNSADNRWQRYTIEDGMPSNDITTIAFEGKYIWFGTLNGGVAVLLTDGGDNG